MHDPRHAPSPVNEPILGYLPGSPERAALKAELERQTATRVEIPLLINGQEIRTGKTLDVVLPHRHGHVIATAHLAGEREIAMAIDAALEAHRTWSRLEPSQRAAIFLRAADLLAGPWRQVLNAATMLNQSKTCFQAEIDAACEMVDFFRFNCHFMKKVLGLQDLISPPGVSNRQECRPLEGFVYAVTPFNFTSIGGNLPHAPALMGNTVVWKPSPWALLSNWQVMRLFMASGLPPGVINFVPGDAEQITRRVIAHPELAGVHYTGSTAVLRGIMSQVAQNAERHRQFPRVVGETGGKDFIVAHPSADGDAVATAMIRGAYEYQGQKCSAASRAYLPQSLWDRVRDRLVSQIEALPMGDPADFRVFMGAVIHKDAFDRCRRYSDATRTSSSAKVLAGGTGDDSVGYFFRPTLIQATDPAYASMREEIFGPVMSVYVYPDGDFEGVLSLCDRTSPYGLTGAIFATDRAVIDHAMDVLRYAAGNFYINDKPTGAVVGQQPFGGGRASGTNDKAGGVWNLLRWITPRTIKETFAPPHDHRYPYMSEA
ncbi:MAG: L-glutamate gamma-semialdehyde dehydrogenase [Planctomycetes bacterium]|nr:L-glutamate gamma-semialdehyde dehydrogenase [Planctomycetota bacterium]